MALTPATSGTSCCRPSSYSRIGSSGTIQPSTLGAQTVPVHRNSNRAVNVTAAVDEALTTSGAIARLATFRRDEPPAGGTPPHVSTRVALP